MKKLKKVKVVAGRNGTGPTAPGELASAFVLINDADRALLYVPCNSKGYCASVMIARPTNLGRTKYKALGDEDTCWVNLTRADEKRLVGKL